MENKTPEEIAAIIATIDKRLAQCIRVLEAASRKYELYAVQGTWLKRVGFVIIEDEEAYVGNKELNESRADCNEGHAKRAMWRARADVDQCLIDRAYWLDHAGVLMPEDERLASEARNRFIHGADEAWRDLAIYKVEGVFQPIDMRDDPAEAREAV